MKITKILTFFLPVLSVTCAAFSYSSCSNNQQKVNICLDTGKYDESLVQLSNKQGIVGQDYNTEITLVDQEKYEIEDIPFILINSSPISKEFFDWDGLNLSISKDFIVDDSLLIYIQINELDPVDPNKFLVSYNETESIRLDNENAYLHKNYVTNVLFNKKEITAVDVVSIFSNGKELVPSDDYYFNVPNSYLWVRGGAINFKDLEITFKLHKKINITFTQHDGVVHGDTTPFTNRQFKTVLDYQPSKSSSDDIINLRVWMGSKELEFNKDYFYDGYELTITEDAMTGPSIAVNFDIGPKLKTTMHYDPTKMSLYFKGGIWDGVTIEAKLNPGVRVNDCVVKVDGQLIDKKYISIEEDVTVDGATINIDKSVCISENFDITITTKDVMCEVELEVVFQNISWEIGEELEGAVHLDTTQFLPGQDFSTKLVFASDTFSLDEQLIEIATTEETFVEGDGSFDFNRETNEIFLDESKTVSKWIKIEIYVNVFALGLDCTNESHMKLINHGTANPQMEYSFNGVDWSDISNNVDIQLCQQDQTKSVLIRGKNESVLSTSEENYSSLQLSTNNGEISMWGDVLALVYKDISSSNETVPYDYCFYRLFADSTAKMHFVTEDNKKFWSATTMKPHCFESMFENCINLTNTPNLTRAALADCCYQKMFKDCKSLTNVSPIVGMNWSQAGYNFSSAFAFMFQNCTSLVKGPSFDDVINAQYAFDHMFDGCTNLTSVSNLRCDCHGNMSSIGAYQYMFHNCTSFSIESEKNIDFKWDDSTEQNTAPHVFSHMFDGCSALSQAPKIDWLRMTGEGAYEYMFANCTNLINAPIISFSFLGTESHKQFANMFSNCQRLETITIDGWTGELDPQSFENWVENVPITGGIFYYKPSSKDYIKFGPSAIPGDPTDSSKRWEVKQALLW